MTPFTLGLNFHVSRNDAVDVYFGPFAAYVIYGDVETKPGSVAIDFSSFSITDTLEDDKEGTKNDFGYGAVAGVDVGFGSSGWFFSASASYLETVVEVETDDPGGQTVDIDPWIVRIGAGVRF